MRIEAYIQAWNREDTIAFTIGHYKQFCDQVILYDNFSSDRTRDIAESMGATVRLFGRADVLDDLEYKKRKNNCWKGSNADWVIVVDDDEIVWEEDLKFILAQAIILGDTIFKPQGVCMHSDKMPHESWLEIQTGFEDNNYSKLCVFNPKAIKEIGFEYGCHTHMKGFPQGRIQFSKMPIYLLHYCFVGGVEKLIDRWSKYEIRRQRSEINMKWNLGHRYSKSESEIKKEWKESAEKSKQLSELGIFF